MKKIQGFIHDINNQATIVLGVAVTLRKVYPGDVLVRKLQHAVEDLKGVVHGMHEYCAHSQATEIHEPLELSMRFEEMKKKLPKMKEKYGIDLILEIVDCKGVSVHTDHEMAQRVSLNCIENAVRAGATKMVLNYQAFEHTVVIKYIDNGKGMSDDEIEQIGFGHTTTGSGQGIGIIRDLVYDAGGIVEFSSKKGFFTQVKITLKRVREDLKSVKSVKSVKGLKSIKKSF